MLVAVVFPHQLRRACKGKNRQGEKSSINPNNLSNKLTRCLANGNETGAQLKARQALSSSCATVSCFASALMWWQVDMWATHLPAKLLKWRTLARLVWMTKLIITSELARSVRDLMNLDKWTSSLSTLKCRSNSRQRCKSFRKLRFNRHFLVICCKIIFISVVASAYVPSETCSNHAYAGCFNCEQTKCTSATWYLDTGHTCRYPSRQVRFGGSDGCLYVRHCRKPTTCPCVCTSGSDPKWGSSTLEVHSYSNIW